MFIVLLSKCFIVEKLQVVSTERGQALADEFGMKFFETVRTLTHIMLHFLIFIFICAHDL